MLISTSIPFVSGLHHLTGTRQSLPLRLIFVTVKEVDITTHHEYRCQHSRQTRDPV